MSGALLSPALFQYYCSIGVRSFLQKESVARRNQEATGPHSGYESLLWFKSAPHTDALDHQTQAKILWPRPYNAPAAASAALVVRETQIQHTFADVGVFMCLLVTPD